MDKYDELCERLMGMPSVMAMRDAAAAIRELKARLEIDPRHSIDGIAARDATIRMLEERVAELETELLGVKEYREKNPLGGPAKVFDAMADQIRAGDDYNAVLKEYGFCHEAELAKVKAHAEAMAGHLGLGIRINDDQLPDSEWDFDASSLIRAYRAAYPKE